VGKINDDSAAMSDFGSHRYDSIISRVKIFSKTKPYKSETTIDVIPATVGRTDERGIIEPGSTTKHALHARP